MASTAQIIHFMEQAFPGRTHHIVATGDRSATLRQPVGEVHTRPGGTVSGPTLMGLADAALYVAIHATLGITPHAVTSNLNIHFLRRPSGDKAVVAVCRLLRVGRSAVVGEVALYSEGEDEPVAHATGSYALPRTDRTTDPA
jgi:uncharacterized protein (TIGR00369 family)